ncbi:MAG TPA: PQQ-binding-like beta-propeller repeat protein [Puia sp.]|nr:PQQ-binding-like beta-propeller repeat protein [Puia sp.]
MVNSLIHRRSGNLFLCLLILVLFSQCVKNQQNTSPQVINGISSGTLQATANNCAGIVIHGTYQKDSAMNLSNSISVLVNVFKSGSYNIYTDTVNGLSFKASGKFTTIGIDSVVLTGSGIPDSVGKNIFTVHYDSTFCDFTISTSTTASSDSGLVFTDGGSSGFIYAFNALSGRLIWQYATGNLITSAVPTLYNGSLYLGTDGGNMVCLDARTGIKKWLYYTGSLSGVDIMSSGAAALNGMMYFTCGDNNLYAIDTTYQTVNGINYPYLKWTFSRGPIGNGAKESPAATSTTVYVGSDDTVFYAIDNITATVHWKYFIPEGCWSTPLIANGMVYLVSRLGIWYALDEKSGTLIWRNNIFNSAISGGAGNSSPTLANGVLFAGIDSLGYGVNSVSAVDALTGQVKWIFSAYPAGSVDLCSPAYGNGIVYIGSSNGTLYAINAVTGKEVWHYFAGSVYEFSSPVYANGLVYVSNTSGNLYCLDAATGIIKWTVYTGSKGDGPSVWGVDGVAHNCGRSGNHF